MVFVVSSKSICKGGSPAIRPRMLPLAPFKPSRPQQQRLQAAAAASGGSPVLGGAAPANSSSSPAQQLLSLLAPALDLLSGRPQSSEEQLCRLSYADSSAPHTPMPDAVRRAFAALEKDGDDENESGNTLCLVTYSEEDGVQLSSASAAASSGRSAMLAFARLNETCDMAAALVMPGGVMDTLCLLSYDEDA